MSRPLTYTGVTQMVPEPTSYRIQQQPFYLPIGDEVSLFESAFAEQIPVLLKGPTGCGKTRFVEFMAWSLGRKAVNAQRRQGQLTVEMKDSTCRSRLPLHRGVPRGPDCP